MVGDQADIQARLKSYLPPWFGAGETPVLDSLLGGLGSGLSQLYGLYAYAQAQTRIATASGFWLDLIAWDFFGSWTTRSGRQDGAFRAYIQAMLLRPKATRPSMQQLLIDITGQQPIIFEPWRPLDSGACSAPTSPGYCGVARCGSLAVPFTCMIQAFRPMSQIGLAGAAFCNAPAWSAVSAPLSNGYCDSLSLTTVSDDDDAIYRAIDFNKVAGTVCWVALTDGQYVAPDPYSGNSDGDGEVGKLDFSDSANSDLLPSL